MSLPHNLEAEQALLGACLLAPSVMADFCLDPAHFYLAEHQELYRRFIAQQDKGLPVDPVLLGEAGADRDLMADCMAVGHSPTLAPHYAAIVSEKAVLRFLKDSGRQFVSLVDDGESAEEILKRLDGIRSAASRLGVPAESSLRFRTASEIAAETPLAVPWIVRPLIALGSVTELVGKPKAAGKTTFLLGMVRQVLDGQEFLGAHTLKTPVVYLTEQTPTSFQEALRRAGLFGPDLHVLYRQDCLGMLWPDVVHQAVRKCKAVGASLLIVDTITPFAGFKGDGENNSGDALAAIEPLTRASADGIAVVVVRHERKGGGEVGESGRGSSAFAGGVDIVLSLRRPEGNSKPSVRVIHALSRFSDTPDTLAIELTEAGYVALGTESAIAVTDAKQALLEVLPITEETSAPMGGLQELLPKTIKRTATQHAMKALIEDGQASKVGKGTKGDPYRFWAPDVGSAGTTPLDAAESNGGRS